MKPIRIFVSSVQNECAQDRRTLRDCVHDGVLVRRFFDVCLFEDAPAADPRPDQFYLDEIARSSICLGLFGREYGSEDDEGVSPTEREFDHATMVDSHRLVFVKGVDEGVRHPKMDSLVSKAQSGLIRKRFNNTAELIAGVYAALVKYLGTKELIRWGPFDTARHAATQRWPIWTWNG